MSLLHAITERQKHTNGFRNHTFGLEKNAKTEIKRLYIIPFYIQQ